MYSIKYICVVLFRYINISIYLYISHIYIRWLAILYRYFVISAGQDEADEEDDLSPGTAAAERLAERELGELGAAVDAKV